MKKRKGPWWWKRRVSCPECGYLYDDGEKNERKLIGNPYITCPRCQVRLSLDEFWEGNYSKYDRKADLTLTD